MNACTRIARLCMGASLIGGFAATAVAIPIAGGQAVTPLVLSGALPDTPAARVDPNVATGVPRVDTPALDRPHLNAAAGGFGR